MKKRNQKRWLAILLCWMMMLTNISITARGGDDGDSFLRTQ